MLNVFIKDGKTFANIKDLKLWKENPRKVKRKDLKRLEEQIIRFGQYKPLIVDENGIVYGGNMRLKVMRKMGIKEVWVSVITGNQKRKLEIALSDNDKVGFYDDERLFELLNMDNNIDLNLFSVDFDLPSVIEERKDIRGVYKYEVREEIVELETLKENPYRFRKHSDEQLEELKNSIIVNGVYRDILVDYDYYILDGHALYLVLKEMKIKRVKVKRLKVKYDDIVGIKILISNNQVEKLGGVEDDKLLEVVKNIKDNVKGSGFNDDLLKNYIDFTKPPEQLEGKTKTIWDEWVGMPDFVPREFKRYKVVVNFESEKDKLDFLKYLGADNVTEKTKYIWWPLKKKRSEISIS